MSGQRDEAYVVRDHVVRLGHTDDLDAREHQHDPEHDPQRPLGHPEREARADQHTRDRADEQPRDRVLVDVAVEQVRDPCDPEQDGGVEHVGADHLRRGERVANSIASPKNVPEPTEVSPTMKPPKAPIAIAISLSRRARRNGASSACAAR